VTTSQFIRNILSRYRIQAQSRASLPVRFGATDRFMTFLEIFDENPNARTAFVSWFESQEGILSFDNWIRGSMRTQWGWFIAFFDNRDIIITCHKGFHGHYFWTLLGDRKSGKCTNLVIAQNEAIQAAFEVL